MKKQKEAAVRRLSFSSSLFFLMLECLGCRNIIGDFVLGLKSAGAWAQNVNVLHA
jgi:hypothetical protein